MNSINFIWKNMVRNRRRTLLTILSIALSLFVLSTLMTVLTELNRDFGKSIIMVTRDPKAAKVASIVRYLDKGLLLPL